MTQEQVRMGHLKLFLLAWLVWDAIAIGLRFGEATPAAGAIAIGILVAWWTRRVVPAEKVGREIALGCFAIIPADISFIWFDVAMRDPTSHNLAPFELIYSTGMGSIIVGVLAWALRRILPARSGSRHSPRVVAIVCGALLLSAYINVEKRDPRQARTNSRSNPVAQQGSRLSAEEVRDLLLGGTEMGRLVDPSGRWEGSPGTRYRAQYEQDGRMTYSSDGGESREIRWKLKSSGALCRGPAEKSKCRFIERRGDDAYAAVGYRSGKTRYEFTVERYPAPATQPGHRASSP